MEEHIRTRKKIAPVSETPLFDDTFAGITKNLDLVYTCLIREIVESVPDGYLKGDELNYQQTLNDLHEGFCTVISLLCEWRLPTSEHEDIIPATSGRHLSFRQQRKVLLDEDRCLLRHLADAWARRREKLRYWFLKPDQDSIGELINIRRAEELLTRKPVDSIMGGLLPAGSATTVATTQLSSIHLRLPEIPVSDVNATSFECPYCHNSLDISRMKVPEDWQ